MMATPNLDRQNNLAENIEIFIIIILPFSYI